MFILLNGHLTKSFFRENIISYYSLVFRNSVRRFFTQVVFGQMVFGQMMLRAKGVRSIMV
jgi:hypothetical protein